MEPRIKVHVLTHLNKIELQRGKTDTFTDDHTRLCWVFLLKEKNEVGQIIQNFCKLVQTLFNTQIQVFRTGNGTEYFNKIVGNVFLKMELCIKVNDLTNPNKMGLHRGKISTFLKLHEYYSSLPMFLNIYGVKLS